MAAILRLRILGLATLSAYIAGASAQHHLAVPLTQAYGAVDSAQNAVHAIAKRSAGLAVAPETLDSGFWYGFFDVGSARNLSLLIDTGSQDVAIDPGLYNASSTSQNLSKSGDLIYSTAQENGCGTANISYHTYSDIVTFANLTAKNQTLGSVVSKPPPNSGTITTFPHQGIVGFSGVRSNETQLGGTPFFQSLCNAGVMPECRFGLAFGTNGTGTQVLGGVDDSLFNGTLEETPANAAEWYFKGGVTVNGTVVSTNQTIIADSGTANIVGPPTVVQHLFDILGIQAVEQNLPGCTTVLFGYYPCDKPPQIGVTLGNGTRSFDVEPSAFQQADNDDNNCTAIVTGISFGDDPIWIVGQAWFQGKYVDFQQSADDAMIGVAYLEGFEANITQPSPKISAAQHGVRQSSLGVSLLTLAMACIWMVID